MSFWPRDAPLPRPIIVGQLFYFPSPPLPSFPRTISPSPPLSLARGQRSNFIFSTQPPSVARDRHFDIITTFQRKNFRSLSPLPCSSSINCLEEGEREREKKGFEYRLNNVHVLRIVIHEDLLRVLVSSIFEPIRSGGSGKKSVSR